MTEEKLQAIKKQLSALVPATWTPVAIWSDDGTTISAVGPQRTNEDDAVRDAYFIAYAPTNMAELVQALEDAQAKYADLRQQLEAEAVIQGAQRDTIAALQAKLAAVPMGPIRRWYENSNPQLMEYEFIADVETDAEFIEAWLETQEVTP